jgi:glycosyltransferase involved in cell wall biosynthesis
MKIAYVTHFDARDVLTWSGTGFTIGACLKEAGGEIEYIGPLKKQLNPINIVRHLVNDKILRKRDHPHRDPGFLRYYGAQVTQRLGGSTADVIVSPGGLPLTYARTHIPMVTWTDCTFANLLDYYPTFSNLSARTIRNGHDAERRALANCSLLLFSSQWAADSAIQDYGIDPAKVHIVPLGSNLPNNPDPAEVERMIAARVEKLASKLTLFCCGANWYRKGIDVAVKVAERLNAMGLNTELLIAGCSPPAGEKLPDYIRLLGFINKSDASGIAKLVELYESSHWFILPTRADCFGIVFCEASSFGVPSLAPRTGGVASAVTERVNGYLFDPAAQAQDWADRVSAVVRDPSAYAKLCLSSYEEYRKRLNWVTSGQTVKRLLQEMLAQN